MATIVDSLYVNLNVIAIGKLFTPTVLGFYSRADTLWNMTMSNFSSILSSVAFPILSTIKNSPERMKRAFKNAVEMLAFVSYPAAVGLVAVAHPLVLALLTRKWEPCVPFLQLLGGVWVLYPMHAINGSVLLAQGRSREYLRLQLLKKALCLILLPLLWLGFYPFIYGQIAYNLAGYWLNCHYSGKPLQYSITAQLRDSFPYIGCALLMGVFIQSVTLLRLPSPVLELSIEVVLGVASYLALCSLFRLPALHKAWEIVRKHRVQNDPLEPLEVKALP
jgi:O-antigen/teichoic acid export membrane protein